MDEARRESITQVIEKPSSGSSSLYSIHISGSSSFIHISGSSSFCTVILFVCLFVIFCVEKECPAGSSWGKGSSH